MLIKDRLKRLDDLRVVIISVIIAGIIGIGNIPYEHSGYKATIDNDGLWGEDTTVLWDKSSEDMSIVWVRSITDFDSIEYQPSLVDGNIVWEDRSLFHTNYRLQINNSADLMNINVPVGTPINVVFGAVP